MGSPGQKDSLAGFEDASRLLNKGWWEQVGPHTSTQLNWEAGKLRKGSHVDDGGDCVGSQIEQGELNGEGVRAPIKYNTLNALALAFRHYIEITSDVGSHSTIISVT